MSEGIIKNKTQIKSISVDEKRYAYIVLDNKLLSEDKLFGKELLLQAAERYSIL